MSLVLVSGANGFIGSHLCARLLKEGRKVRALVRRTSNLAGLAGIKVQLAEGDVTERESLDKAMEGVEIAFHVAGFASDWGSPEKFTAVNLGGTRSMAEAAKSRGVKRFVHVSSTAVHGFGNGRYATEDSPRPPTVFPYNESKRLAEEWLLEFSRFSSMEVVMIRPGNVFGPRDSTFIAPYLDAIRRGWLGYIGGGRSWTCPTYVENLVYGIALASSVPGAAGMSYIITDGLDIDWRTFTEKLARAVKARAPRYSLPFRPAYGAAAAMEAAWKLFHAKNPPVLTRYRISNAGRDYHFSIEKAKRMLGYQPPVGLDEAIRRTVAWYLKQPAKS